MSFPSRISDSFKNLFWNLFGYEEPLSLDHGAEEEHSLNNGTSTQIDIIGTTLLGAYHVIAIIVLANILIAMVTNTYNTIEVSYRIGNLLNIPTGGSTNIS